MMSLLAARKQAAKEAWLQLSAGEAAQASIVTIQENLVSLMQQDRVSTRKGVSFWGSSSLSLHHASDLPPSPGVAIAARASGQHCDNLIEVGVVSVQGSGVHQEGVAL